MSTHETTPGDQRGIVVGVDGSESSKAALRWAARQAELTKSLVHAVIAWQHPTVFGFEPSPLVGLDVAADALDTLNRAVDEALGQDRSVEVKTSAVEGHAAPVLLQAAEGADLLVVGQRGHGGFPGLTLGSVSAHCVQHAPCPVVVVRYRRG